jgi:hypothetical protein
MAIEEIRPSLRLAVRAVLDLHPRRSVRFVTAGGELGDDALKIRRLTFDRAAGRGEPDVRWFLEAKLVLRAYPSWSAYLWLRKRT